MTDERQQHATVRLVRDYQFVAEFGDVSNTPSILFDEPPPLGDGRAPNASAVLSAAVGDCLAASLALCLRKAHLDVAGLTAHVTTRIVRNDQGRLRIGGIEVELEPDVSAGDATRLERCERIFENFCTVTSSVREGIPVAVHVKRPGRPAEAQPAASEPAMPLAVDELC